MERYIITDEQLDVIDNSDGVEIIRTGRKNLNYRLIGPNRDGGYTRVYESDEMLADDEVLVHFYGEDAPESFILKAINDTSIE